MERARLTNLLTSAAVRMRTDFEETALAVEHNASKGPQRERIVAEFLKKYLPATAQVVQGGQVFDVDGGVSKQCDILIIDPATPPLFAQEGFRLVPAESVYAVIEVKSKLDSAKLREACKNIRSVKERPPTAFIETPLLVAHTRNGKSYEYVPAAGYVFAFDGISLKALGGELAKWRRTHMPDVMPDGVLVLGKGGLRWIRNRTGLEYCEDDAQLAAYAPSGGIDVLPYLVIHLHRLLSIPTRRHVDLEKYLGSPLMSIKHKWNLRAAPAAGHSSTS